jgi:polysaccharide export outer membrane protein
MKIHSTKNLMAVESSEDRPNWRKALAKLSALVCVVVVPLSGCTTTTRSFEEDWTPYASIKLVEGDVLSITFPGSPDLNTTQQIRRDGKIDLKTVGEFPAAGKTPAELEKEILKLYEKDLVLKEASVILQSSSYPVFVTGSVMHPGKLMANRPMSALEAIMEAGGFDNAKANMRRVVVLRNEEGQLKRYVLDLQRVLDGKSKQLFYLRPSDIVYVPEKAF